VRKRHEERHEEFHGLGNRASMRLHHVLDDRGKHHRVGCNPDAWVSLMDFGPVDYSAKGTPKDYRCGKCDAHGCKLWREYQIAYTDLFCCDCGAKDQNKNVSTINDDGLYFSNNPLYEERPRRTDQIGWLVPAIPTKEGYAYWGYSSAPEEGIAWWRALPTRPLVSRAGIFVVTHNLGWGTHVDVVRAASKEDALKAAGASTRTTIRDVEELPLEGGPTILWTYETSPDTPHEC
jgi:hypothetical protein